ncbi:MAG: hydrogenase maturation nickel metallochaperone HypA [Planctomycetes bacterium RBG_13_63_9]|nr:MAG: hydrogenase maturation nickel metallochaperone HypA [Planctomycetes bacterium RBG_13_63_9]
MHEVSLVEMLIQQVGSEVDRCGHTGRVVRLELAVGPFSGVHGDSLRFAFELLSPGTLVEGAEMEITKPRAICRCGVCDAQAEIDEPVVRCPECHAENIVIEGGRELILQSIELEDD